MIPVLCIVVTCLAQEAPRTVGDPKLFDVLRAAQETNRTAFRSGAMNARVEQIFPKEKVLTNLEAEITWLEDKVIWKYREEQTVRDGATIAAGHMEKLPWNYMMRRGDKVYAYAASTGHVHIRSLSGMAR